MGYFTDIADKAFKKGERGETLFYLDGLWPWNKPFIIEDDAQRKIVYSKHLWFQRIVFPIVICGQPIIFAMVPEIKEKALWFIGYLALLWIICWVIQRVVFWPELNKLKRRSKRLSLTDFYGQMAETNSKVELVLGLITCMFGVALGIWLAFTSGASSTQAIGVFCIILFCALGFGCGFALKLKVAKS